MTETVPLTVCFAAVFVRVFVCATIDTNTE